MIELCIATGLSTAVSAAIAQLPWPAFLIAVMLVSTLVLPALLGALLLDPGQGGLALAVAMLPILAWGWRRVPAGQWRTARSLGGSRLRIVRTLVAPTLAPFLLAAVILGMGVVGVRWRLDRHPAPIFLPDPVTATG